MACFGGCVLPSRTGHLIGEHIPLPPIRTLVFWQVLFGSVTHASATHRLTTALVAVVFGMSWGAPVLQAFCTPTGHTGPNHCGSSPAAEHCCERDPSPAVCGSHYARQDLLLAKTPTPEPSFGGASLNGFISAPAMGPSFVTSIPLSRRAIRRAVRRHVHVGVWLE